MLSVDADSGSSSALRHRHSSGSSSSPSHKHAASARACSEGKEERAHSHRHHRSSKRESGEGRAEGRSPQAEEAKAKAKPRRRCAADDPRFWTFPLPPTLTVSSPAQVIEVFSHTERSDGLPEKSPKLLADHQPRTPSHVGTTATKKHRALSTDTVLPKADAEYQKVLEKLARHANKHRSSRSGSSPSAAGSPAVSPVPSPIPIGRAACARMSCSHSALPAVSPVALAPRACLRPPPLALTPLSPSALASPPIPPHAVSPLPGMFSAVPRSPMMTSTSTSARMRSPSVSGSPLLSSLDDIEEEILRITQRAMEIRRAYEQPRAPEPGPLQMLFGARVGKQLEADEVSQHPLKPRVRNPSRRRRSSSNSKAEPASPVVTPRSLGSPDREKYVLITGQNSAFRR
eukprot:m51a1_g3993 hypothetical protein (402) ;mRNA; f:500548-502765